MRDQVQRQICVQSAVFHVLFMKTASFHKTAVVFMKTASFHEKCCSFCENHNAYYCELLGDHQV